jgi:hypothetical protein
MQSQKRLLPKDERSPSPQKRVAVAGIPDLQPVSLARLCRREFLCLASDATCFFSVLVKDIVLMLARLLEPRPRGKVRDPGALRFEKVLCSDVADHVRMICFDRSDNLVVTWDGCSAPIHVIDKLGCFVCSPESGVGTCAIAYSCVADSTGRMFVSWWGNTKQIREYSAGGVYVRTLENVCVSLPCGLALSIDESILYIADYGGDVVRSFQIDTGEFLRDISPLKYEWQPCGVAVLSNGFIAVSSCIEDGDVHIFTADNVVVRSFGAGELRHPRQIAVDADDNLYVVNSGSSNVVVYSASGQHLARFGSRGTLNGEFRCTFGIAIDSTGTVAVSEFYGKRVQLFRCQE